MKISLLNDNFIVIATGLLFILALQLPVPAGMTAGAWHTALIAIAMATLWMTVALPLAVTALLPLLLFPLLQVQEFARVTTAYADPILFLFLGAMVLGQAIEQQGLHRRLVLLVTGAVGCQPVRLIAALMLCTFFISMWINNTATVAMVLPLAVGLVRAVAAARAPELGGDTGALRSADAAFAKALILGVAYASILGGSATLIGTPSTAVMATTLSASHYITISFIDWMLFATPLALLLLVIGWWLLCFVFFRPSADLATILEQHIHAVQQQQQPLSRQECWLAAVFILTVLLWMGQAWLRSWQPALAEWLNDSTIALGAAFAVFALRLAEPQTLRQIPWDVLLLLGGGLALAAAITHSGLSVWLAGHLQGAAGLWLLPVVILLMVLAVIALSELASNVAIVAAFLPILASVAPAFGVSPLVLGVPLTLAATFAFMLPAGTPSNALAFSTGYLSVRDMIRAGLCLNVAAGLLVTVFTLLLAEAILG